MLHVLMRLGRVIIYQLGIRAGGATEFHPWPLFIVSPAGITVSQLSVYLCTGFRPKLWFRHRRISGYHVRPIITHMHTHISSGDDFAQSGAHPNRVAQTASVITFETMYTVSSIRFAEKSLTFLKCHLDLFSYS